MGKDTNRHFAVIDPVKRRIRVVYENQTLVESEDTLILKEVGKSVYDPVYYFPRDDFKSDLVADETRSSHCPIKGDASYWNLGEPTEEYFAWSYEDPLPMSRKIKGYIALNPRYFTFISEPLD